MSHVCSLKGDLVYQAANISFLHEKVFVAADLHLCCFLEDAEEESTHA